MRGDLPRFRVRLSVAAESEAEARGLLARCTKQMDEERDDQLSPNAVTLVLELRPASQLETALDRADASYESANR